VPALPLNPRVKARLGATPREGVTILVNEDTKRPWAESTFEKIFAAIRAAAGLSKELQFRDFRRTGATETVEAGATDDEFRSVTGPRIAM
jgi:hypothetical protein